MKTKKGTHLFTLLGTPITADLSALMTPLTTLGWVAWASGRLAPERSWPIRLRDGLLGTVAYLLADAVHAIGHIISARMAQAPMDEFYLAAPLPRTLYEDNDVSPTAHRLRAVGGPIASIGAGLVSLLLWPFTQAGSALRTLAILSGLMNSGLGFGSLLPFPFIDGGVLLKWTLVERGQQPEAADQVVRQTNLRLGGVSAAVGLIFALRRSWLAALGCFLGAALAIGVALNKSEK